VDAWTPITAVLGVYVPDCDVNLSGGVITCIHTALVLGTAYLPAPYLVFTTSATYSGTVSNAAVVTPTGHVTDNNTSNNNTGSVDITVAIATGNSR
jgi:hypothetical protein